jgi:benzoyl-CoA reductase/2-hydroxyglutaryl-CoA dehydratase subunit BcrC/BadD/HgdB
VKILSLSGFVPEYITDIVRFTHYNGTKRISHFCGYVADYISQVQSDTSVDGAVFPRSCDSCRVLPDYLSACKKFIHQINIPARQDEAAIRFFASCIQNYHKAVERHYGVLISDIAERTERINERNRKIFTLYESIADFSYSGYLENIHDMLTKPLTEQTVLTPQKSSKGDKTVFLVGSFLSDLSVVKSIEKAGLQIAGDNLTESKRLFSTPAVKPEGDIYRNIAASLLNSRLSPTQNNFSAILEADIDEIKKKDIDGVIFVTQKYCEPYDYLFASYKRMLNEHNIPVLRIVLTDTADNKRAEMAIETFADIL